MAVRHAHPEPPPLRRSAVGAGHLGRGPGLAAQNYVSSMNTRRSGSRSSWRSNQSWRRLRMSGRSCSAACAVFFCA
jgi:hypothetical protein